MKVNSIVRSIITGLILLFGLYAQAGITLENENNTHIIEKTIIFTKDDLVFTKSEGYDLIYFSEGDLITTEHEPMIPVHYVHFSLPIGMTVSKAEIISDTSYLLEGSFTIKPGTSPRHLSSPKPTDQRVKGLIYQSQEFYPGINGKYVGCNIKSGYPIATIALYPIQYIPKTGELYLNSEITIRLSLTSYFKEDQQIYIRSQRAEQMFNIAVKNLVVNPEDVPEAAAYQVIETPSPLDFDIVEYLIVTHQDFVDEFRTLADWKTKKGIPSEVVSWNWIVSNYAGIDVAEKIRNCIIDYWQNKGLVYVLLGGDVSSSTYLPTRTASVYLNGEGWQSFACDLYFSDLQNTWNDDGDSYWGEWPDDNIDMFADVYVGRAPCGSSTEIDRFVEKVLQYEGESSESVLPLDYQEEIFFMGSYVDAWTDMGVLKDHIETESVPSYFTITKRYQSLGNLNANLALNEIDEGENLINHAGHGLEWEIQTGSNYLSLSSTSLTNDPRFTGVFYTLACLAGKFGYEDCFGEMFVNQVNGGGMFIGNSHNGLYYVGDPDHFLSARQDRNFWLALLDDSYNYDHLGEAFGEGRDLGVFYAKDGSGGQSPAERQCLYELNLLGDPELPIWKHDGTGTDRIKQLTLVHDSTFSIGSTAFTVTVTAEGSAVDQATVCLWKEDEVYLVDSTNGVGEVTFNPIPQSTGNMFVTATKINYLPAESEIEIVESPCLGDLNGDNFINVNDFTIFASAYGSHLGDPNYNPDADLNGDNFINVNDFTIFASVYGTSC